MWVNLGEQGWRSGESTRLPPMWPGFDSRTRRHKWVEFVVGSRPCSERFFFGYSHFPLSLKTNISKFQFDPDYCQALYHEPLAWEIVQALPSKKLLYLLYFTVVGYRSRSKGFSPGSPIFLSPRKTNMISKFQFNQKTEDEEPCVSVPLKFPSIYLFYWSHLALIDCLIDSRKILSTLTEEATVDAGSDLYRSDLSNNLFFFEDS